MNEPNHEAGFSIIEAIVSFAIVSLVLVSLYEAIGAAYRGTALVNQRARVVALASAKLEALGTSIPLRADHRKGRFEQGIAWDVNLEPLGAPRRQQQYAIQPYWVRLRAINRRGNVLIELETVKLARQKR